LKLPCLPTSPKKTTSPLRTNPVLTRRLLLKFLVALALILGFLLRLLTLIQFTDPRPSGPVHSSHPGSTSSSGSGSGSVPMKSILRANQPPSKVDSGSTPGTKSKATSCASPHCNYFLNVHDKHSHCIRCLGPAHWQQEKEACPACNVMSATSYNKRVKACQVFLDTGSWPSAIHPRPRTQDGSVKRYGSQSGSGSGVQSSTSRRLSKISATPLPVDALAQKLTNAKYSSWAPTPPDLIRLDPIVYFPAEFEAFRIHFKGYADQGDMVKYVAAFKFLVRCFRTMLNKGEFYNLGAALPTSFRRFESNPIINNYFPPAEVLPLHPYKK